VLEDLGAEQARDDSWADTRLYKVLEFRNTNKKAIIWTSNLSKQELLNRYKMRLISSLIHLAPAIEAPTELKDRRFCEAKARLTKGRA
jgi:hypothetical protein